MCFILTTNNLDDSHISSLEDMWHFNSHGAGIATHDGKRMVLMKPFMNISSLRRNLHKIKGQPAMVHLRQATHGAVNGRNTHPFWTCGGSGLMSHNGVLPDPWSSNRQESDSRRLAESLMGCGRDDIERSHKMIGSTIGHNKVAIMWEDGSIFHINKHLGHNLDNNTWCSANPDVSDFCYGQQVFNYWPKHGTPRDGRYRIEDIMSREDLAEYYGRYAS